jgi:hypothetical protein
VDTLRRRYPEKWTQEEGNKSLKVDMARKGILPVDDI